MVLKEIIALLQTHMSPDMIELVNDNLNNNVNLSPFSSIYKYFIKKIDLVS